VYDCFIRTSPAPGLRGADEEKNPTVPGKARKSIPVRHPRGSASPVLQKHRAKIRIRRLILGLEFRVHVLLGIMPQLNRAQSEHGLIFADFLILRNVALISCRFATGECCGSTKAGHNVGLGTHKFQLPLPKTPTPTTDN
jgi:hypothetical protein